MEVHLGDGVSLPLESAAVERTLHLVLDSEGVEGARLSLAFVGDEEIAQLNEEYLGHSRPTDVISFPLHAGDQPPLGDIYVGVEQAARQAAEVGIPLQEELLRLAIHGALHVLGYDHPDGEERLESRMYLRQEELLRDALRASHP
ncbi:MAG TPA: rRNA maturation RNase YbeY [Longimicrobiaceae bacterium]|nr:rRNA maturation RNase YbeY [Longimicrobiaceae bacterium]